MPTHLHVQSIGVHPPTYLRTPMHIYAPPCLHMLCVAKHLGDLARPQPSRREGKGREGKRGKRDRPQNARSLAYMYMYMYMCSPTYACISAYVHISSRPLPALRERFPLLTTWLFVKSDHHFRQTARRALRYHS